MIGTLYATATTTSGCLIFLVGRGVDNYGARNMTLYFVVPGLIIACLLSSYAQGPITLWLSYFMLRYFG